jgi:hypothetical protein
VEVALGLAEAVYAVVFALPDGGGNGGGMMVAVVAPERTDTLTTTEDGDPVTAPAELVAPAVSLSGHSVVVFVVVPTTMVRVPLAEPVMASAEDVAGVGVGMVSLSVHVLDAPDTSDTVDGVAVYVGVHSSAGRAKVPL